MSGRAPFWLIASTLLLVGLTSCSKPVNTADSDASAPAAAETATPETATSGTQMASPAANPNLIASADTGRDLTPLFSHVWRVTVAPSEPAPGSIYVFLANGTFLQTSCVETYALSGWTVDKETPDVLQVSENGEVAFTAEILELTNATLKLRQTLVRSGDTQDLTLSAIEEEFVCPDLPR